MKFFKLIKSHWKLTLGIITLIASPVAYASKDKLPLSSKPQIETVSPERKDLQETLSVSGEVAAEEAVVLKFQTSGLLSWVGVKKGDPVKKFQAIASLDKRQLRKTLEKEMNDYLSERGDFEQTQEDNKSAKDRHLVTDSIKRILDKAQLDLTNSVLDYEIQDLTVRLATLTSPINGIVTKVDTPFAGVNISPATAEFEIVNPESVYFSAEVDETDISKIKTAQSASLILDAYPEEAIASAVQSIEFSPKSGGTGTVYETKLSLPDNNSLRFRLGLNGDALITLNQAFNVLTIPEKALLFDQNKPYVEVLEKDQPVRRFVSIGITTDEYVEITSGLNEGDLVVLPAKNAKKK
ncbi:efflux RND transporter periplasmic adaptor subunit [Candidatus Collierbacteria bacterium]|nr:efflux RND transporter periplasmic adaptor subunit [Candidatus Collierbacteria bacterium]